ncbi:MAG: YggS family pyridoxal phosphate-dependent enzyme [Eubacterium sp.]|jgi:pyridoxal phosphate enzyme (YggS family)
MTIAENIESIRERIAKAAATVGRDPREIKLVAVTKLHTPQEINEAIDAGITDAGENKVQELVDKYDKVKHVNWHLIGHLQTNKVKYIIDKVCLIHSVDSLHIAKEIDKRAAQHGISADVLVQINPAGEETKFGVSTAEADPLIEQIREECPNVNVKGIMCIAPYAEDTESVRKYFAAAKYIYDRHGDFTVLSMGMSHDFEAAVKEGSNLVRIGTSIFGQRDYRSEEK